MFLLVTGASGAGKSTVRCAVAAAMRDEIECVELHHVSSVPSVPDIAWRQRATEAAVRRAVELQSDDRHLLLSGDPVAAGEVLAAPSAANLEGVAVCLLDLTPEAQTARLTRRGDDPALFPHHHAFADWMRGHAGDPRHMPHVLSTNGWEAMRWERWTGIDPGCWDMEVIDTSELSPDEVATKVVTWCRRAVSGHAPVLRVGPGMPPPAAWPAPTPIETRRLVLEPLRIEHAEEMVAVLDDRALYEFAGGDPPRLAELRARYVRQVAGHSPDGAQGWLNWVMRHRSQRVPVGSVQATLTSENGQLAATMAWTVGIAHQRRGYATEAATAMVRWLRHQGVVTFAAHVRPGHDASIGVARRLGLVATGVIVDGEAEWAAR